MSSLSDQLLKAGLVTKEQVEKAAEKPKKHHNKANKKPYKSNNKKVQKHKQALNKKDNSDLAQFYKQRDSLEKTEKLEEQKRKQEAARIKKETNEKINKLLSDNLVNDENAEIRYNFVVGTTIKYLFVNQEQQQKLANLNPNKIVVISDPIEGETENFD